MGREAPLLWARPDKVERSGVGALRTNGLPVRDLDIGKRQVGPALQQPPAGQRHRVAVARPQHEVALAQRRRLFAERGDQQRL